MRRERDPLRDLDFMLLRFHRRWTRPTSLSASRYCLANGGSSKRSVHSAVVAGGRASRPRNDPWRGRLLVGEVHDENAAALGGIAGHAGLFGTAAAVGSYARHLLQVLEGRAGVFRRATLEGFVSKRADIPGSSRALGWDTMLPTSSCGTLMSARAFGHTGFTGTSLWVDPEKDVYVVLLTNRVHPTRANEAIKQVRPTVHDAVMGELR
jgi:CubicO group peptidase (beta-lactamase class C family)